MPNRRPLNTPRVKGCPLDANAAGPLQKKDAADVPRLFCQENNRLGQTELAPFILKLWVFAVQNYTKRVQRIVGRKLITHSQHRIENLMFAEGFSFDHF